ncbi:plasmid mobilization protein [Testudinibacter sp. P27/CKL/0425]
MTGKANARQGDQNKSATIQLRCTQKQKDQITFASQQAGKSISHYLLDLADKDINQKP